MNYTTITPPATEPVDLNELKQFLRITHDSEDALLTTLIRTAREMVEDTIQQMLIERRIRLHIPFDLRNRKIRLMDGRTGVLIPLAPIRHVHHVHSILVDGQKILMSRDKYSLTQREQSSLIIMNTSDGVAMDVDCTIGYGLQQADVPAYLRHLVLQWALHLYEHRDLEEPPLLGKIREWLWAYRKWRLQ